MFTSFIAQPVSAPTSCIDPHEQAAFYDPGLGSRGQGGFPLGRLAHWIYRKVSQATGLGITRNIIDCYAAIIRLAKPDDRLFFCGFSRGAYTVRCVAAVVALCGIPTRNLNGSSLRLDVSGSKKLAKYAVKHIYQFTSSRKKYEATAYQKFLLEIHPNQPIRSPHQSRSLTFRHQLLPHKSGNG